MAKHSYNFDVYYIIQISSILPSAYIALIDQEKNIFYVNNYIDWN